MNFVLDNSVTMRWLFEDGSEKDLDYADRVLAALAYNLAVVPVTWGLEVANVVSRGEGKGLLTPERSDAFLKELKSIAIEVDQSTFDYAFSDILQLSRKYRLTANDASYLELALRKAIPISTLDENLRKAARKAGVKSFDARSPST